MTDGYWTRLGGVAGLLFVLVAVVAGAITGKPPPPQASDAAVKAFFVDKQDLLVTQAWLYALGAALLLWFAVGLRPPLRAATGLRHLSDLFFAGTAVISALLLVAMAIQVVVARAAERLSAGVVRTVGLDFGAVLIALWGFVVATTALAYVLSIRARSVLPRWTAWLAAAAIVLNLAGTVSVFVRSGPFSSEGAFTVWLPALSSSLWYLAVSIAMLRSRVPTAPGTAPSARR
jgi:hypothetical protein